MYGDRTLHPIGVEGYALILDEIMCTVVPYMHLYGVAI